MPSRCQLRQERLDSCRCLSSPDKAPRGRSLAARTRAKEIGGNYLPSAYQSRQREQETRRFTAASDRLTSRTRPLRQTFRKSSRQSDQTWVAGWPGAQWKFQSSQHIAPRDYLYMAATAVPPEGKVGLWVCSSEDPNAGDSGILGYVAELELLRSFLNEISVSNGANILPESAAAGSPRHVFIEGAPGSGKTLFANYVRQKAEKSGLNIACASAVEADKTSSYALFQPVFQIILIKAYMLCCSQPQMSSLADDVAELSVTQATEYLSRSPGTKDTLNIHRIVRTVLEAVGEDIRQTPLLNALVPVLRAPDNDFTAPATGKAREELVRNLAMSIAAFVCAQVPLLLVLDELQWADQLSISLIRSLILRFPTIRTVCITRSLSDCSSAIQRIASEDIGTIRLTLGRLNRTDAEKLIIHTCTLSDEVLTNAGPSKASIRGVESVLLDQIYQKTGGNPLAIIDHLAYMDAFGKRLRIDGDMLTISPGNAAEILTAFDFNRLVTEKLEQLPTPCRKLLMIASVIGVGQYTSSQLLYVYDRMGNAPATPADIQRLFAGNVFSFFVWQTHSSTVGVLRGHVVFSQAEKEQLFQFRDLRLPAIIRASMSQSAASALHLLVAQYYEEHGGSAAQIARHYLLAPADAVHDAKRAMFLEILAAEELRAADLSSAITALRKLDEVRARNSVLQSMFDHDSARSASLYYALGSSLIKSGQHAEGERHCRTALRYCGFKFPSSGRGVKRAALRQALYQRRNYKAYVSSDSDVPAPSLTSLKATDSATRRNLNVAIDCFGDLATAYFLMGRDIELLLVSLWGLNSCQELGQATPHYAAFLGRAGMTLCSFGFHDVGHLYLARAVAMSRALTKPVPGPFYQLAFVNYARGDWTSSLEDLNVAVNSCRSFGVVTYTLAYYFSAGPTLNMRLFRGDLDSSPGFAELFNELYRVAKQHGDDEARLWCSCFRIAKRLMARERGLEVRGSLLGPEEAEEPDGRQLPRDLADIAKNLEENPASRKGDKNELTALGVLAALDIRTGRTASAAARFQKMCSLTICLSSTSIIAFTGLTMAVLALYELFAAQPRLLARDRDKYAAYAKGIEKMARYFLPKYKFASFTVHLARALPYFLNATVRAGMSVSGLAVLQKGRQAMDAVPENAMDAVKLTRFSPPGSFPSLSSGLSSGSYTGSSSSGSSSETPPPAAMTAEAAEPPPMSGPVGPPEKNKNRELLAGQHSRPQESARQPLFDQIPLMKALYLIIMARYARQARPQDAEAWKAEAVRELEDRLGLDPRRFLDLTEEDGEEERLRRWRNPGDVAVAGIGSVAGRLFAGPRSFKFRRSGLSMEIN